LNLLLDEDYIIWLEVEPRVKALTDSQAKKIKLQHDKSLIQNENKIIGEIMEQLKVIIFIIAEKIYM
jgi:hypothetical protein